MRYIIRINKKYSRYKDYTHDRKKYSFLLRLLKNKKVFRWDYQLGLSYEGGQFFEIRLKDKPKRSFDRTKAQRNGR